MDLLRRGAVALFVSAWYVLPWWGLSQRHTPEIVAPALEQAPRAASFTVVIPKPAAPEPPPAPVDVPEPVLASKVSESVPTSEVDDLAEIAALPPAEAPSAQPAPRKSSSDRKSRKSRGKRCEEEPTTGIAALGADQWAIDDDIIRYYATHLREADRLAATAWHRGDDGKVDGFSVRRLGCSSVLRDAGFKNGDVITSINGKKIRTVPQAIAAYARLRTKKVLHVEVMRQGAVRTLRYELT